MKDDKPASLFDLSGKVALITGGSRGLGREIVLGLARAGAKVAIASRKLEACEAVAEEVRAFGGEAEAFSAHVGHWAELDAFVDEVYARCGRIDVLVNNAGLSPLAPSLADVTEALYDKVFEVNLKGPFRLSAIVGARMKADGGGSIINISSTGALMPLPLYGPYASAKAGLNALATVFALEYGPMVRVNTLSAGPFLTDVSKAWPEEQRETQRSAIGRPGAPEEIVGTALYLASDASSFTSGALIRVDGGLY